MSLHQPSYVDSLTLKALTSKGTDKNAETGHHKSMAQKATEAEVIFFLYAVTDETDDDN